MGSRLDLSVFEIDRAMRYALYEAHRFCMRLPGDIDLIGHNGKPKRMLDTRRLAIIVHEYFHFIHNISTVAGWTTYELFLRLLAIFSNALVEDGTCDPSQLDSETIQLSVDAIRAIDCMEGASRLPPDPSRVVGIEVSNSERTLERIGEADIPSTYVEWRVCHRDGRSQNHRLRIGASLIEEGIAFILENGLRTGDVNLYPEGSTIDSVPVYPYAAFYELCKALSPAITPIGAIQIGVLALNTNRPGPVLLDLLGCHAQGMKTAGTSEQSVLEGIEDALRKDIHSIIDRITSHDVPQLQNMFKSRGLLEEGAETVSSWFNTGLTTRRNDFWYDLRWAMSGTVQADVLSTLLHDTQPCDIIFEGSGSDDMFSRDTLLTCQGKQSDAEHSRQIGGVRALQAQICYLLDHLSPQGIVKSETARVGCPYYTSCVLPMRRDKPEVCQRGPWASGHYSSVVGEHATRAHPASPEPQ